jgi:tripartite-type tricarboxylate transporter receptor subunit TctC
MLSGKRWSVAPEIPTADEAGLAGLNMSLWFALWAPMGTPDDVVARLNVAVREAFADPALRQRFEKLGQDIPAPELQTPAGLLGYHKAEIEKWWPIIKAANIKVN